VEAPLRNEFQGYGLHEIEAGHGLNPTRRIKRTTDVDMDENKTRMDATKKAQTVDSKWKVSGKWA